MTTSTALALLETSEAVRDHIVGKALEVYGISRHYAADRADLPKLDDSDPLRAMLGCAIRSAVAIALHKLATGDLSDVVRDYLGGLASDLDLTVLELHDEA